MKPASGFGAAAVEKAVLGAEAKAAEAAAKAATADAAAIKNTTANAQLVLCPAPNSAAIRSGAKRGPKPAGTGPHNLTIERRIKELEAEGMEHVGGGRLKEEFIRTDGGLKTARRPDITMRQPDGSLYRENVGKFDAKGNPIKREGQALDDLEAALGVRPGFTPYNW